MVPTCSHAEDIRVTTSSLALTFFAFRLLTMIFDDVVLRVDTRDECSLFISLHHHY